MNFLSIVSLVLFFTVSAVLAQNSFESDTIKTSSGNLEMCFIGHGTLFFTFDNLVIHIDPVSECANYAKMPKADIILITHQHHDHFDPKAIALIKKENTEILYSGSCDPEVQGSVMKNGDKKTVKGLLVEAVPAYNILHKREANTPFHPKGEGNGYILTCGDKRIYIGGDTENIPEMRNLKNIDIAFLPMNLPYTMTPEMAADAALMFKPKVLYPYHYGKTDPNELVRLLKGRNIEVKVRNLR
jgi:L-ascorbate metabolism protein UlaG (beta-lactamase superfamily)